MWTNLNPLGNARDNNVMHAKPGLRVQISNWINRSGSVITDVIQARISLSVQG